MLVDGGWRAGGRRWSSCCFVSGVACYSRAVNDRLTCARSTDSRRRHVLVRCCCCAADASSWQQKEGRKSRSSTRSQELARRADVAKAGCQIPSPPSPHRPVSERQEHSPRVNPIERHAHRYERMQSNTYSYVGPKDAIHADGRAAPRAADVQSSCYAYGKELEE